MKSCELSDNEIYEIKDYSKFIKSLKRKAMEKLKNEEGEQKEDVIAEDIGIKIGAKLDTVESWFKDKCRPNSYNLEMLIDEYELDLEEAGIVVVKRKGDSKMKEKVGERIRELLAEKGIKQVALARAIGESSQKVSKWCKGINMPNDKCLKKIANFFGVSLDYLLTGQTIERDIEIEMGLKQDAVTQLTKIKHEKEMKEKNQLFQDSTEAKYIVDITETDILNYIISETNFLKCLKLAFQEYLRLYKKRQAYKELLSKSKFIDKEGVKKTEEKFNEEEQNIVEGLSDEIKKEIKVYVEKDFNVGSKIIEANLLNEIKEELEEYRKKYANELQ